MDDEKKETLAFCVICCLVQNRDKCIPLFQEFDFKEEDFGHKGLFSLYQKLMKPFVLLGTKDLKTINQISEYLPTSDNYRYYAEELYSLNKLT